MKIGIHHRFGSFSDRWVEYCDQNGISYRVVNAYASDIVSQLADCDGFMWHWTQDDYRDQLFARQLIFAMEAAGKLVFPNSNTAWHFDDKVGQKYLLELVGAPLVNSHVFYEKKQALKWARNTTYPKVFKLRGGAGSQNVRSVNDIAEASRLIKKAFGRGYRLKDRASLVEKAVWVYRRDGGFLNFLRIIKSVLTLYGSSNNERLLPKQRGYVYFQDFVPANRFDDRLVVIGNRCFCIRRHCRVKDFRASGSGVVSYEPTLFPKESIRLAHDIGARVRSQSLACDFVYDVNGRPLVIEISFGFRPDAYYDCVGYFDKDLIWHNEKVNPQNFIIQDFVQTLRKKETVVPRHK